MSSVIFSHPILIVAAFASGLLTILNAAMPNEHLSVPVRLCVFLAAGICIIAVQLAVLVGGGSQEEIVCFLLCVLACRLTAERWGKGGGR